MKWFVLLLILMLLLLLWWWFRRGGAATGSGGAHAQRPDESVHRMSTPAAPPATAPAPPAAAPPATPPAPPAAAPPMHAAPAAAAMSGYDDAGAMDDALVAEAVPDAEEAALSATDATAAGTTDTAEMAADVEAAAETAFGGAGADETTPGGADADETVTEEAALDETDTEGGTTDTADMADVEAAPDAAQPVAASSPAGFMAPPAAAHAQGAYGPDSAVPHDDGSGPDGWEIKGNEDSMLYHGTDSPWYARTKAEVWFRTGDAAEAAGFTNVMNRRDTDEATAPAAFAAPTYTQGAYGPDSAVPHDDGSGPDGWEIKGNEDSMLYHGTDSPWYARTKAEVWFRTGDAAEAAGFTNVMNRGDSD